MNILQAKQEIKNTVRAYLLRNKSGGFEIPIMHQRPILLMGAPGLGKTAIMRQIAEEENIGFVSYNMTHHTRQSALGLPLIRKEEYDGRERDVTAYTMSEIVASIYELMRGTGKREGILFLDEINCVSETLAPVILQLLQAKMFGRERIPEGWVIVAAGNPAEYNKAVREFDMATLDRVRLIEVEPDVDAWRDYASDEAVHGAIMSYLQIHKENFYKAYITADGMSFVTARGWEDLSDLLRVYEAIGVNADIPQIAQYIRDNAVAADFAAFYEMYKRHEHSYAPDDIFSANVTEEIKLRFKSADFDEKTGVIGLITAQMNSFLKDFAIERMTTDTLFSMIKKAGEKNQGEAFAYELRSLKEEISFGKASAAVSEERRSALQAAADIADKWIAQGYGTDVSKLRELFFKKNEETESRADEIRSMLDNVYDFLEDSKSDGTELVLFTSELASGSRSLDFIRSEGYERFFAYNKELLGGDI